MGNKESQAMNDKIATRALTVAMMFAMAAWVVGCGVAGPQPTGAEPSHSVGATPPPAAAAAPGPAHTNRAPVYPQTSAPCVADELAPFPWPNAPEPSVSALIPPYLLFTSGRAGMTLMDVARRLEGSITGAGYLEPRYLGAGCNGFAIMLDLEHIEADGTRKRGVAGFTPSSQEPDFNLADYVKRLFYAPPGYYRQIVFVVSEEGMAATIAQPTEGQLRAIAKDGTSALPPSFAAVPYTWKHKVVALVFEYQKGSRNGDARQIPPTGRLGATVHLKKAKLY
jgi:hypothetical protein